MFSNSIGQDASGRTDLQESPEPSLHDTRRALIAGVPVQECRVHAALVLREMTGLDAIEAHSGLGRKTLLGEPGRGTSGILPAEGQSSALLHCVTRGVFTEVEFERRPMAIEPLRFGSPRNLPSAHHQSSEDSSSLLPEKGLETLDDLEDKDLGTANGAQMTSLPEAPWIEAYADLLDPSNDLWRNRPYANQKPLGDAGWALALVWGFQPVQVPLEVIQAVLGKSAQQTQRIVDKLGFARTKGRGAVVTVDLSFYVSEACEGGRAYEKGIRAGLKLTAAHRKRQEVGRRGTRHGYAAYRVHQHRELVAQTIEDPEWRGKVLEYPEERLAKALEAWVAQHDGELPQWALAVFGALRAHKDRLAASAIFSDAITEAETEEHKRDLARHKARLVDAKPADYIEMWLEPANVPDTPEALAQKAKEGTSRSPLQTQPAREVDPEVLAAMRARICASTYA